MTYIAFFRDGTTTQVDAFCYTEACELVHRSSHKQAVSIRPAGLRDLAYRSSEQVADEARSVLPPRTLRGMICKEVVEVGLQAA